MCMNPCVCATCVGYQQSPEEAVESPGVGLTGGCELPDTLLGTKLESCARTVHSLNL